MSTKSDSQTILGKPLRVFKGFGLRKAYYSEVQEAFSQNIIMANDILTEQDIEALPKPVRDYIKYTGAIGKEKVRNFRLDFKGEFKMGQDKKWVRSRAEQYSFIDNPRRIYYMKLSLFGIPVLGLHVYKDVRATMLIKLANLITVGDAKGEIMNRAETVTVFNDMCLMAPATLIDKRIKWRMIDSLTVEGTFNNNGVEVSAILYFNEKGELVNFVSNDRYMTTNGDNYINATWSTPVSNYVEYKGIKIASYGEAHWSLPEGDFCYGKLYLKEIQYNII